MDDFDTVDVQGHDPIMEYGAWLRSVTDLAEDTQGCADYLPSSLYRRGTLRSTRRRASLCVSTHGDK